MLLGRFWEAEAWSAIATQLTKSSNLSVTNTRASILSSLRSSVSWQATVGHVELTFDLSKFDDPLKDYGQLNVSPTIRTIPNISLSARRPLLLREIAAEIGIRFYGKMGDRVLGPNVPLSQSLGCGGAAIDYDLDGRCDLLFAAAGGTVGRRDSQSSGLFRNTDHLFIDNSQESGYADWPVVVSRSRLL